MTAPTQPRSQHIIVSAPKSVGASIAFAAFFGPIGMLYSTVKGGVVMCLVSLIVVPLTLGIGLLLTWPVCVVWAVMATNEHNRRLVNAVTQ